ncbi:MAG TPA: MetQ/NlpA family ABC transporter substrate-binding protein [Anaerolineae bacterium]
MLRRGFGFFIAITVLLAACAQAPAETPTLKIGLLPVLEALPIYVADAQGYFKSAGITVEYVPVASAAERDQLMQAGQIDGMINDLVSTVLYNKDTQKISVVRFARTATPESAQYSILAAKGSGITKVSDLKGVEVGISEGTVIAYVTDRLLQQEGLQPAEIKTTNVIKIADRMQLLNQGNLKAATIPDPFSSLALQNGATVVVDDRKHNELGNSVLSFSTATLNAKPNTVKKFLAALEKAVQDVNANPDQFSNVLTDKKLIPAPLAGKYKLPKFPAASVPTEAQFKDVEDWMTGKNLLKSNVPYSQLVDTSYLPK